ncbi:MAG: GNAT family N-acetyltransferase [Oscillospiraceae bacterium]|jgi:ribosomal protein S18 acetylase RimI-like enzyme|nr:GNAT family N-acetyltransferase [Oscillospiraceae bacterium]
MNENKSAVTLETERLTLRPPTVDDAEEMFRKRNYSIRPMTLADYPQCFALWQITSGADTRHDCKYEVLANILARNPDTCYIAEQNGIIIATVTCEFGGDGAYISHLAVAPELRRMGIAKTLVAALEQRLDALGVRKSRILVFSGNTTAEKFWREMGYGTRDDVFFMDKEL